ncbi:helix-turn-helix domain-containing protein [Chitinibacter tainanensis]|uniref:helix-turn-helix domain-containing protein n=1 Tax=Chitinibacter tainanensis TaxID=230667 RepID=UPI001B7F911D|nr:helix-turn-helix transcriptional regulator [Chitinibacter tainanensis]
MTILKHMSPFSRYFYQLRMNYGLRQVELAELVGYDQTYVSALENGTKGPPTPEFIERLIRALSISESEQTELYEVVEASQRKLIIPSDVSEAVYWLLLDLKRNLTTLHPAEIDLIRGIMQLDQKKTRMEPMLAHKIRRRTKGEVKM